MHVLRRLIILYTFLSEIANFNSKLQYSSEKVFCGENGLFFKIFRTKYKTHIQTHWVQDDPSTLSLINAQVVNVND